MYVSTRFTRFAALAAIGLSLSSTGCSLSRSQQVLLSIEIPQGASRSVSGARLSDTSSNDPVQRLLAAPQASHYDPSALTAWGEPESLDEINCFGVNVVGIGIPQDHRMSCADASEAPHLTAGLIQTSGNVLSLQVPGGLSRRIDLIGFRSANGECPSFGRLLDLIQAERNGERIDSTVFDNLEGPYLIGQTTVDITQDAEIRIKAAFDPSRKALESCKGPSRSDDGSGDSENGQSITPPLAAAIKAHLPSAGAPDPINQNASMFTSMDSVLSLAGAEAATAAQTGAINTLESSTNAANSLPAFSSTNALIHEVSGDVGTSTAKRPVIQLRWDVTDYDPALYPVMHLDLQIAGGFTTCNGISNTDPDVGVRAALLTNASTWDAGHTVSDGETDLRWSPFYRPTPAHFITDSGRKYVILSIESTVAAQGVGCVSRVVVGGAQLRVYSMPPAIELKTSTPQISPYAPGEAVMLHVHGGVPPYSFSSDRAATFDSANWTYNAPISSVASDKIRVTDSTGSSAELNVSLSPVIAGGQSASMPTLQSVIIRRAGTVVDPATTIFNVGDQITVEAGATDPQSRALWYKYKIRDHYDTGSGYIQDWTTSDVSSSYTISAADVSSTSKIWLMVKNDDATYEDSANASDLSFELPIQFSDQGQARITQFIVKDTSGNILDPATASLHEGNTVVLEATASGIDPNGNPLTYIFHRQPAGGGIASAVSAWTSTNTYTYTITSDDVAAGMVSLGAGASNNDAIDFDAAAYGDDQRWLVLSNLSP